MPAPCAISAGVFLSTPSSQRATDACALRDLGRRISIHALFAEGDATSARHIDISKNFYPRPLRRGRPRPRLLCRTHGGISIHALFAEGDGIPYVIGGDTAGISIHALFAEGDVASISGALADQISIHALFAEGDLAIGQ